MNNLSNLIIPSLISLVISISTAIGTALVTSFLYWRNAKIDLQKEYESRFNIKRWETYLGINQIIQDIYYTRGGDENAPISLEDTIALLRTQILLIGSNDVVRAFVLWQKQRAVQSDSNLDTFKKLHELVVEMRKDLGIEGIKLELDVMQGLFPLYR